jgi:spore coat polysaccharide biosynthesis protein SpsF (cytidylyltransferase family)|tara:strand:- start:225 stop:950 length:726 start_codon:yes stop_codon:yes gene_type:complete
MIKIPVIIQARENSKRFPGKIFKKIGDKTILEIILSELSKSKLISKVFIASSLKTNKDKISKISSKYESEVFFGSETNVLSRYIKICKKNNIKSFVRLTADNPLISYTELDKFILFFKKNKFDYVSNLAPPTYPEGYSIEIIKTNLIKKIFNNNPGKKDKEHVTYSIVKKKIKCNSKNIKLFTNLHNYRLTCDYRSDLVKLNKIFKVFKFKVPTFDELRNNKIFLITSNSKFKKTRSIHYA